MARDTRSRSSGDVGYRKPPKHSQWKPGQSGNPRGRPKHRQADREDVAFLDEVISTLSGGERTRMSRQRALDEIHFRMAANGDKAAARLLYRRPAARSKENVATALALCKEQAAAESAEAAQAVRRKLQDMAERLQAEDSDAAEASASPAKSEPDT